METLYARALRLLQTALRNPSAAFREGQWEAIEALVARRERLLLVQRTGWGKSLVYFIAARLLREHNGNKGLSLLISPLLSLMRNQVEMAERMGIHAETIHSANTHQWDTVESKLFADTVDLLLISPERLANAEFYERILQRIASRIVMLIVDEAHCISDWGHDFRPDYRRIVRILRLLPGNVPVLATTATANDRVVEDIRRQLGEGISVQRGSLARRSLQLQNIVLPSQAERLAWLAEHLDALPGSGIIYALTVADAERVARWLRSRGYEVYSYHADLDNALREELEQKLLQNEVKALVATVALGMGFDKPDLGFVVHFQRPGSVVHYYQQIGRAGRALEQAVIVLLGGEEDDEVVDYFIRTAFPPQAHTEAVLNALRRSSAGLSLNEMEQQVNLSRQQLDKVLRLLASETPSPILQMGGKYVLAPVAYVPDTERIQRLTALRRAEQEQMQQYLRSTQCLMLFLQRALDDPYAQPCGRCAVCRGEPIVPIQVNEVTVREAIHFLRRSEVPLEPRKMWPSRQGLSLAQGQSKIPEQLRPLEGRALCLWGDAGWGTLVRQGKYIDGFYSDQLVEGMVEMIRRWQPQPAPQWLTCVPSLRHPHLVPNFAQRLAQRLGIPFVACVRKVRETHPQKEMQNSFHQVSNLDGAFEVDPWSGISQPVFLVDDVVDSGWTLTVIAVLLRRAGSGPVFPIALAKQVLRGG
ncbi:MAG: RecQ family ATP-dependent DNA helicase [Armatimonadota bacterium]|nr:RecQ family ATP-dependent DNA helicase [Armatimonadota bacterium]